MAVLFAASSSSKLVLSRYANAVLQIAHRWPRIEIIADGGRASPSIFSEGEYRYCIVALHAGSGLISLRGSAVEARLTPATCLGVPDLSGSSFKLELTVSEEGIEAETDHVSSIPLFTSRGDDLLAAGSWGALLGPMREHAATPPSTRLSLRREGVETKEHHHPRRAVPGSLDERIGELAEAIEMSVRRNVARRCCVLFSGGLDSSLLARALQNVGARPLALTIGLEGSHDKNAARNAAVEMGIDNILIEPEIDELGEYSAYLRRCLYLGSPMDVALALLVFIAASEASSLGRRQLVAGQGADELFGGYAKYQSMLRSGGPEAAERQMMRDVGSLWSGSVPRDYAAAAMGGCLLTLPYLDREVASYALALPLRDKVSEGERKLILRRVAARLGLPPSIAHRPKKAAQYGTGFQRVVEKLG